MTQNVQKPHEPELSEEDRNLIEKYAHTFLGCYEHSLDSKGRLVVPQAFREELGQKFYVCPAIDGESICLYSRLGYAKMRSRYEKVITLNRQVKALVADMDTYTFRDQEYDTQGRILLPQTIRQNLLREEKEVVVNGANDHVEILAASVFAKRRAAVAANREDALAMLDDLFLRMEELGN